MHMYNIKSVKCIYIHTLIKLVRVRVQGANRFNFLLTEPPPPQNLLLIIVSAVAGALILLLVIVFLVFKRRHLRKTKKLKMELRETK